MISFGLVTIPVKVYSAARSSESISFNLLHKDCGSRLKQQYVCQRDGQNVERAEMVKGFEFSKGQYVLFSEEELKALEEKSSQTIEITEFVPASAVDPVYFDKAYYLGPDRQGDKAYRLLAKAMQETGRWAVARYGARGRNYLVVLRPNGEGLVMQQLHYAHEVRPFSEIGLADGAEIREQELKLALLLAEQVSAESFVPENYLDDRRTKLQELVDRKVAGEQITTPEAEEPKGQVIDLMEALRQSLAEASTRPRAARALSPAVRKPARHAVEAEGKARKRKASK
jgi:DNA end-binding protein Ku